MTLEDLRKTEIGYVRAQHSQGLIDKDLRDREIDLIMQRPETKDEENILMLYNSKKVFEAVVVTLDTQEPEGYKDWLAYTDAMYMIKRINDQLKGYK